VTMPLRCVLVLLTALSAGCGSTSASRFFALSTLATEGTGGPTPLADVVERVQVADYLQRPQLVRRRGAVELEVLEYDRWAEPLDLALTRVLNQDLRALLGAALPAGPRVNCSVLRFEEDADGSAVLEARYTVRPADAGQAPRSRTWIARSNPARAGDPASLAEALAALVHELARALAAELAAG